MKIFAAFENFSGLHINYNKTKIMRLGLAAKTNARIYSKLPLIWSDGPVKILGMWIDPDIQTIIKLNHENALKKVEGIFKLWSQRSLSLIGKVLVVNTLAVPQFMYIMQCLPIISETILSNFQALVRKFIWSGCKPKVSLECLQQSTEKGGLNLIDLKIKDRSIKFALFHRILNTGTEMGKNQLCKVYHIPAKMITDCNLDYKDTIKLKKHKGYCRTVKVTGTEPYYIRAVPATKASLLQYILC